MNNRHNRELEFGYHAELRGSRNAEQLTKTIHHIVERLGFTDYVFIDLKCTGALQNTLNTLPVTMLQKYVELNFSVHDMVLQRARTNTTPFLSSTIHNHIANAPFISDMTSAMFGINQLSKSFGFYDYLVMPTHSKNGCYLFSVAIRGARPIELGKIATETKHSLVLLAEAIEYAVNDQFPELIPHRETDTAINAKPLRVLNTLANSDLTIEQVANKLCISVVTANQHLKTVRRKLGVKTNYAAIRRALTEGLIEFEEGPRHCLKNGEV
jgi:DNA-binding CsgD family transcriptional regulator